MRADQLRPDDDEDHAAPKRNRGSCEVGGKGKAQTFKRKMFRASRLADFATESELTKQTGQPVENWPLVVVKELADNALDDAEKAGVAPVDRDRRHQHIHHGRRQGLGIAPATVKAIVDYSFQACRPTPPMSAPTRGQQGNALQILFAMPYVLNGKEGEVLIESQGVAHTIRFTIDPVRQTPVVSRATSLSAVKNGTRVTVRWPNSPRSDHRRRRERIFIARRTLRLAQPAPDAEREPAGSATSRHRGRRPTPSWSKWRPSMPTSAHWYDAERLQLSDGGRDRPRRRPPQTACLSVRDFIGQFRGLSGTAKATRSARRSASPSGETLADFFERGIDAAPRCFRRCRASRGR